MPIQPVTEALRGDLLARFRAASEARGLPSATKTAGLRPTTNQLVRPVWSGLLAASVAVLLAAVSLPWHDLLASQPSATVGMGSVLGPWLHCLAVELSWAATMTVGTWATLRRHRGLRPALPVGAAVGALGAYYYLLVRCPDIGTAAHGAAIHLPGIVLCVAAAVTLAWVLPQPQPHRPTP